MGPRKPWRFPRKTRATDAPALVPYPKPLKSFRQQAEQLKERGMEGDVAVMEQRLASTNYYRLSGYWYFFRVHQGSNRALGEQFRPNTSFDLIWELYVFDSKLRALATEAIERIEIAVRTQISFHHGKKFGLTAYALDPGSMKLASRERLPGLFVDGRDEFLAEVQKSLERSHEQFIDHFYETYSDEYPPIFVASEVLTLGCIKQIYDGSSEDVKRAIANHFVLPPSVLGSWLLTLNTARNVCAHHGRFWNRAFGVRPKVPPHEMFRTPVEIFAQPYRGVDGKMVQPPTTFAILSMCSYLLEAVDPRCGWGKKVQALLREFPRVKKVAMGFPDNWTNSPVWLGVD